MMDRETTSAGRLSYRKSSRRMLAPYNGVAQSRRSTESLYRPTGPCYVIDEITHLPTDDLQRPRSNLNLRTMRLHDRAVFGDFWPHGRRDEDARAESVVSPISHGQRRAARCRNLPIPHRLRIDYP